MKRICHACQKTLDIGDRVGRREACPFCGRDLHVCLNCRFYAPGAYNDCRETQAERVVEKDRSNFCDFFAFRDGQPQPGTETGTAAPKDRLESLFKK
jgi:hypothetical protein